MGKSSSQVVGYRYYAKFAAFIGNRIEKLLAINFDNRKWVIKDKDDTTSYLEVKEGNLFGENEGGVSGVIDIHLGTPDQEPNAEYQKYFPLASGYPYQSYLVFRGLTATNPLTEKQTTAPGFYLGNSGYMKEMLLWPKRIHVRNDGRAQWYDAKSEIDKYFTHTTPPKNDFILEFYTRLMIDGVWGYDASSHSSYSTSYNEFTPYYASRGTASGGTLKYSAHTGVEFIVKNKSNAFIELNIEKSSEDSKGDSEVSYKYYLKPFETFIITQEAHGVNQVGENDFRNGVTIRLTPKIANIVPALLEHGDINPIHKIREILTDDTAMNKPESSVNDDNFIKAADRIWDEGLGISWSITEKSCIDAINELCYHIEAGIRVNRQTGLYEMVLFRDDWFEENEVHDIEESKIKDLSLEVMNSDDIVNQLNVTYYDRERIKNSTFSICENGSILTMGHANAESVEFPYFMNMRNAEIVANWKLKQFSTPAWSGSFSTGWREARKWNRYDLIHLPWSKKWNGTILVRIMKINLGNGADNTVTIDFEEVIPHSGEMSTSIVVDESMSAGVQPPKACQYEPFEMPYYLAVMALGQRQVDDELNYENNFGLVGVVAEKPQSNSLYAVMMTHDGTEGEEWLRAATINYVTTADLDQIVSKTSSSFVVKDGADIASVPIGTLIKCGSDWIGTPGEWMVFMGIDPYTGVVSVKRGASDTLPQDWGVGTKLYFCGTDVAYDATEYVSGEEVLVSALTTTPSGVLELKGSIPIEMKARAIRPYPPANVKINGEYWPAEIETDLILTWVDRNRVQQTGGGILGWFEGGVTIEPNTQTHLILTQLDENDLELATINANVTGATSYTMPISIMQASARTVRVTLKTVRDGYECLNSFVHTVELSQFFSAPYDLTVEFKND
ncbi:hypothetical protein [Acinetobacter indicus]|uniref:hypothetical protein n=1 Tax=Acinetobacter indicus TaxID=756892 RepID=UPI0032B4A3B4